MDKLLTFEKWHVKIEKHTLCTIRVEEEEISMMPKGKMTKLRELQAEEDSKEQKIQENLQKQLKRQRQQKAGVQKKLQQWKKKQAEVYCQQLKSNLKAIQEKLPPKQKKDFGRKTATYLAKLRLLLTWSEKETERARREFNAVDGLFGEAAKETRFKQQLLDLPRACGYIWGNLFTRPTHLMDSEVFSDFYEAETDIEEIVGQYGRSIQDPWYSLVKAIHAKVKEFNPLAYDYLDWNILLDRAHGGGKALEEIDEDFRILCKKAEDEWNDLADVRSWKSFKEKLGEDADQFQATVTQYLASVRQLISDRDLNKKMIQQYLDRMNKLTKYAIFSKTDLYQTFLNLNEKLIKELKLEADKKVAQYRAAISWMPLDASVSDFRDTWCDALLAAYEMKKKVSAPSMSPAGGTGKVTQWLTECHESLKQLCEKPIRDNPEAEEQCKQYRVASKKLREITLLDNSKDLDSTWQSRLSKMDSELKSLLSEMDTVLKTKRPAAWEYIQWLGSQRAIQREDNRLLKREEDALRKQYKQGQGQRTLKHVSRLVSRVPMQPSQENEPRLQKRT